MTNIFLSERMDQLLTKAAEALKNGSDPFDNWFLRENEVTADECYSMSNAMALIIGWAVKQPASTLVKILLHEEPRIAQMVSDDVKQNEIIARLIELGAG